MTHKCRIDTWLIRALVPVTLSAAAPFARADGLLAGSVTRPADAHGAAPAQAAERGIAGCSYQLSDGTSDGSIGWPPGGGIGWLNKHTAASGCERITAVLTAWNQPGGSVPDGAPAMVHVWDDPDDDGNPLNAVLVASEAVVVQNSTTGIQARYPLSVPPTVSGVFFVGASITHPAGQYPLPLDAAVPYVAGSTFLAGAVGGTFNAANLAANPAAVDDIAAHGFPYFAVVGAESERGFTYQGRLLDGGAPLTGSADLQFQLYDAPSGGGPLGPQVALTNVSVTDGLFTADVPLDPALFDGGQRYLGIAVRSPAGSGTYAALSPRQPVTPTPLAWRASSAAIADSAETADAAFSLSAPDGDPPNAVVVDNQGRVGVGTAAPERYLHVQYPLGANGVLVRNSSADDTFQPAEIVFERTPVAGSQRAAVGMDHTARDFFIWVNGADRLTIADSGNVGIGTSTPGSRLEVAGGILSAGQAITHKQGAHLEWNKTGSQGETWLLNQKGLGSGGIRFGEVDPNNNIAERMRIDANGNVGIGTASPTARLQIGDGNLRFRESTNTEARIENAWDLTFAKNFDSSTGDDSWFRWFTNAGNIENMRIDFGDEAAIRGDGTFQSNGIDFAEAFKAESADLEPGDVVSLAIGDWEYCRRTAGAYDAHILGVVSTQPAFLAGLSFNAEELADEALAAERRAIRNQLAAARNTLGQEQVDALRRQEKELTMALGEKAKQIYRPVALAGRVPTKIDGRYGPIRAGDRLTSSPTPGHAMKQTQPGMSIGVALEDFNGSGTGSIIALIQPGWHGGAAPARQSSVAEVAELQAKVDALESRMAQVQTLLEALSK